MPRLETRTIFTLDELSPKARETAVNNNRYWNVEYCDWWESTFEDARRVGLEIKSFDLGPRPSCEGYFTKSGEDTARAIIAEHGPDCATVADAIYFLKSLAALPLEEGEESPSDDDLEACEGEFLRSLLEDYRIMLGHEYEYLLSDDAVAESLVANEVEFLEDGTSL